MKFKVSTDPKEILKIIKKYDNKDECIIWQSTANERLVQTVEQVHIDNLRKIIKFKLNKNEYQDLDPTLNIYIKLSFRNTIFKGELIGNKENDIFVNIPDEVQFEELREFPRFTFGPHEDKSITLSVKSSIVANSLFNLKVKLQDISQTGLSFLVSHANYDLVIKNDMTMSALGPLELENPLPTSVVYTDRFSYRENGKKLNCLKMGARLENQLNSDLLNTFIRSFEGFDHSSIGFLGHEFEFQNSLHYQMETMFKHLKRKNELFDSIEQATNISQKLKENEYFSRHIKLLAKMSCGIAKMLGHDSKKVLEKLIYASFVHDVAYYANPKLSLIKDMKHFKEIKDDLNSKEEEIYKNAPKLAFDFAFYDKFAPKGVETILMQSKELPDGSGYPNHLTADKIHPLAAIFIVAHDLTDYIFERKSWNYYEYILRYHRKFNGGIFDEIFIELEKALKTVA